MSIYVGNLSYEVVEDELKQVFLEYGEVKSIYLPMDREAGRIRGFAFVEMGSDAEEATAIESLDGAEWMGRSLRVNKAKPKPERSASGGGGRWQVSNVERYYRHYLTRLKHYLTFEYKGHTIKFALFLLAVNATLDT